MGTSSTRGFCEDTIYEAVVALLAETGYHRLTMDAVATRAHASKATLYRHWNGKPDLVACAVKRRPEQVPALPDTGNLGDDLLALLGGFRDRVRSRDGDVLLGVVQAMRDDPELAHAVRARLDRSRTALFRTFLEHAGERGYLKAGCDGETALSAAFAELTSRHLVRGEPLDDQFLRRLVDGLLLPALTRDT